MSLFGIFFPNGNILVDEAASLRRAAAEPD